MKEKEVPPPVQKDFFDQITEGDWMKRNFHDYTHTTSENSLGMFSIGRPYSRGLVKLDKDMNGTNRGVAIQNAVRTVITTMSNFEKKGRKMNLSFGSGNGSYVNGDTVVIDTQAFDPKYKKMFLEDENKMLDATIGFAVHEMLHRIKTHVGYVQPRNGYTGTAIQKKQEHFFRQMFWNLIEDERIEHAGGILVPGYAPYLAAAKRFAYAKSADARVEIAAMLAMGDRIMREIHEFADTMWHFVRYPAGLQRILVNRYEKELTKLRDLMTPFPETEADVMRVSSIMYDMVAEKVKELTTPPPQESQGKGGESEDNKDGEEGEPSKGGKKSKKDKKDEDKSEEKQDKDSDGEGDEDQKQDKQDKSEEDKDDDKQDSDGGGESKKDKKDKDDTESEEEEQEKPKSGGKGDKEESEDDEDPEEEEPEGKSGSKGDEDDDSENEDESGNSGQDDDDEVDPEDSENDEDKSDDDKDGDGDDAPENTDKGEEEDSDGGDDKNDKGGKGSANSKGDSDEDGDSDGDDPQDGDQEKGDASDKPDLSNEDKPGMTPEELAERQEKLMEKLQEMMEKGFEPADLSGNVAQATEAKAEANLKVAWSGMSRIRAAIAQDEKGGEPGEFVTKAHEFPKTEHLKSNHIPIHWIDKSSLPKTTNLRENSKARYASALSVVAPFASALRTKLMRLNRNHIVTRRGLFEGELDETRLADTRARTQFKDFYTDTRNVKNPGATIVLLIDESGSMAGLEAELARMIAVMFERATDGLNSIELFVYGHTTGPLRGDTATTVIHKYYEGRKTGDRECLGQIAAYDTNRDGHAILEVGLRVRALTNNPKNPVIMFVVSDGQPSASTPAGFTGVSYTKKATEYLEKHQNTRCIHIAIHENIPSKDMFKEFVKFTNFASLVRDIGGLLERIVTQANRV